MIWYVPSFYGDIRVKRGKNDQTTRVEWENLTPGERKALEKLFLRGKTKGWTDRDPAFGGDEGFRVLGIDLKTVQKMLVKELKPGRQVIDFVRFSDGKIVEQSLVPEEKALVTAPEKGVSVAKPVQGCPEPWLARAELRAREVLFAFLDDDQRADFEGRNAFVSTGAGTGHRYAITSRHARDQLAHTRRQLFDLDERQPYCVHDYAVPAAEEMLALHLMLQDSKHERYLRHLE